jgi:hypothetical protein
MTGGASSIAFPAASSSLMTIEFASSICTCIACNASRNLATSWAFASSRSVCIHSKQVNLDGPSVGIQNTKIQFYISIDRKVKITTLNRFSNCKRHVSSSTRFSNLSFASLRAPDSLAAYINLKEQ